MNWIYEPWPWYVSGPLIGLMVPALLIFGNKHFGISSTFRHICAACIPAKTPFFSYDWKKESWSLFLAIGIITGSFLASYYMSNNLTPELSEGGTVVMAQLGIPVNGLSPEVIFNWGALRFGYGWLFMVLGGFLVGFGTRWANGCTSGHAIMGLSLLNPGSLVAVIGFFIGGLFITHLVFPYLF